LGAFPDSWKISVVKILEKSGKEDYREPKAYRPISLLPVFAKVLEKLLITRITYYLENKGLLNKRQYGFTAQRSTVDAIAAAVAFIKKAYKTKGFALLIALDIIGAFDNAWWPIILDSLRNMKCSKNLYYLTKSYFTNRYAKLWYQNIQTVKKLSRGCPQGSACGQGFWNVIFNSCLNLKFPSGVEEIGFADDTLLEAMATNVTDLELKVNHALDLLSKWSICNKLEFNPKKTSVVLFTKNINYAAPKLFNNNNNNNLHIYTACDFCFRSRSPMFLGNHELNLSNSFKYLGVHIDSKLTWKVHVNYIRTKAQQLIMALMSFAKKSHGLNNNALEIIYKGAVIPIISYACPV
jgi:hypothetical protein